MSAPCKRRALSSDSGDTPKPKAAKSQPRTPGSSEAPSAKKVRFDHVIRIDHMTVGIQTDSVSPQLKKSESVQSNGQPKAEATSQLLASRSDKVGQHRLSSCFCETEGLRYDDITETVQSNQHSLFNYILKYFICVCVSPPSFNPRGGFRPRLCFPC